MRRRCDLAWPCKRQKCAVHAVCPEVCCVTRREVGDLFACGRGGRRLGRRVWLFYLQGVLLRARASARPHCLSARRQAGMSQSRSLSGQPARVSCQPIAPIVSTVVRSCQVLKKEAFGNVRRTEAMKEAFGESCGVEWSCESEVGSRRNGAWPPAPVRELELNRCPREPQSTAPKARWRTCATRGGWQDVEEVSRIAWDGCWACKLSGPGPAV